MEIAVLSDIHGNSIALRICLEYCAKRDIQQFIFLGDYLGEFAYPYKTMELLTELKKEKQCYFIKGNKEDYWLNRKMGCTPQWKETDSTTGCLFYNYENITPSYLDFFESLKGSMELHFPGLPSILACHGSPDHVNEKLQENHDKMATLFSNSPFSVILCGHSHIQKKVESNGIKILNPGSVGLPLRSRGNAQFLILTAQECGWDYEFISETYDIHLAIEELHQSGLYQRAYYWSRVTEYILQTGLQSHGTVLARAMELCREDLGVCNCQKFQSNTGNRHLKN